MLMETDFIPPKVNRLKFGGTIFKIKCIVCGICLLDSLVGPADKHFIVHISLNGQAWKKWIATS